MATYPNAEPVVTVGAQIRYTNAVARKAEARISLARANAAVKVATTIYNQAATDEALAFRDLLDEEQIDDPGEGALTQPYAYSGIGDSRRPRVSK